MLNLFDTEKLGQLHTVRVTDHAAAKEAFKPDRRVVLADTQPIYRIGMKNIFALEDDIRVIAQVETLPHLHAVLEQYPTDVVVLDGQLLGGTLNTIPELLRRSPDTKLIVQLAEPFEATVVELYGQGVRCVISRSISADLFVKCVRRISDGETWIGNSAIGWVIEAYRSQTTSDTNHRIQPKLSGKQLTIVRCITRGMRNKEIAYQIGTTEPAIKNCLRQIYEKLGVSDRLELASYALHNEVLKKDLEDLEKEGYVSKTAQPLGVTSSGV